MEIVLNTSMCTSHEPPTKQRVSFAHSIVYSYYPMIALNSISALIHTMGDDVVNYAIKYFER